MLVRRQVPFAEEDISNVAVHRELAQLVLMAGCIASLEINPGKLLPLPILGRFEMFVEGPEEMPGMCVANILHAKVVNYEKKLIRCQLWCHSPRVVNILK